MIFIVVKFAVRPEVADQWPELVREFTEATRQEPGNLWFDWSRSLEDPNEYVLLEAFRDGEAGAAHVTSEHFKQATQQMPEALQGVPRILHVEVPGSDWSELAEMAGNDGS